MSTGLGACAPDIRRLLPLGEGGGAHLVICSALLNGGDRGGQLAGLEEVVLSALPVAQLHFGQRAVHEQRPPVLRRVCMRPPAQREPIRLRVCMRPPAQREPIRLRVCMRPPAQREPIRLRVCMRPPAQRKPIRLNQPPHHPQPRHRNPQEAASECRREAAPIGGNMLPLVSTPSTAVSRPRLPDTMANVRKHRARRPPRNADGTVGRRARHGRSGVRDTARTLGCPPPPQFASLVQSGPSSSCPPNRKRGKTGADGRARRGGSGRP